MDNPHTDVYFNLAAEEYLLKMCTENYFMLWQSAASVVIGKHQCLQAEVNMDVAQKRKINLARRFSGGGAVYQDAGNINLTFIETTREAKFDEYLQRVLGFLTAVGINAHADERLGIYIDGLKVSGSAQSIHKNRVMYHCTLLYTTDLKALNASLNANPAPEELPAMYGVASVHSEVTNIYEHLPQPLDTEAFRKLIFRFFLNETSENQAVAFGKEAVDTITRMRNEKYADKEWIFHKSVLK